MTPDKATQSGGHSAPVSYSAVIVTDASCRAGRSAWAAWIRVQGAAPFLSGGSLPDSERDQSTRAELRAIRCALAAARDAGGLSGSVLLLSDSLTALGEIRRALPECRLTGRGIPVPMLSRDRKINPDYARTLRSIRRLVRNAGACLSLQHVKAHNPRGAITWPNVAADILARAWLDHSPPRSKSAADFMSGNVLPDQGKSITANRSQFRKCDAQLRSNGGTTMQERTAGNGADVIC